MREIEFKFNTFKTELIVKNPANVNCVSDYIVHNAILANDPVSVLKLHKLLYYVQAWYITLNKEPLLKERFQAWVHGAVCRPIYDRFKSKSMYAYILAEDINADKILLSNEVVEHIDSVLEVYMPYSGTQLENINHSEEPWLNARKNLKRFDRCENYIDESDIFDYYSQVLKKNG